MFPGRSAEAFRMAATLTYHGGTVEVSTVDELGALVTKAQAEGREPSILELVIDSGAAMSIGLGREMTVLGFVPGSLDPPYYASLGDLAADGFIEFAYGGQFTEFPLSQAIPLEVGIDALLDFFVTGTLSQAVTWQEV
jgi:hypothetical protein